MKIPPSITQHDGRRLERKLQSCNYEVYDFKHDSLEREAGFNKNHTCWAKDSEREKCL